MRVCREHPCPGNASIWLASVAEHISAAQSNKKISNMLSYSCQIDTQIEACFVERT